MNKSERFNRRYHKNKKDKKLLYLERELNEIYAEQRKSRYITLDKPVQRGYKRTYRLKARYQKSSKAKLYTEALKYINPVAYNNTEDFDRARWYVSSYFNPKLDTATPQEYAQMSKEVQELFIRKEKQTATYRIRVYYEFSRPYVFELYVSRNMVTKIRYVDPDLLKRKTEIENYIRTHNLRPRINKLNGYPTSGGEKRCFNTYRKKALLEKYLNNLLLDYYIE